jgi:8-oxo-dGTP pyrophosphatase MutT (NUDIX family)
VDAFDESNVHAQAIREAMEESGIPLGEVWIRYFSFTGAAGEYEIDAYLNGSLELPTHERDLLAHAVNELINELPPRRKAPYSDDETTPSGEPKRAQEDSASEDRT